MIDHAKELLNENAGSGMLASIRIMDIVAQGGEGFEEASVFLFEHINELVDNINKQFGRDRFEAALAVLNWHVPPGWNQFLDRKIEQLHSGSLDTQHQIITAFVTIMSGCREMRFPNLERENLWLEVIVCLEHKNKSLRKHVADLLIYGLAGWRNRLGASNPNPYIPLLKEALTGKSSEYLPECFSQLATCGYDISIAIPILQERTDSKSLIACVMHSLNMGDLNTALQILNDEVQPYLLAHILQRVGESSKFQDYQASILFLGHFLDIASNPHDRYAAASGCWHLVQEGENLLPIMEILCQRLEDGGMFYGQTVGSVVAATLASCSKNGFTKDIAVKRLKDGLQEKTTVQKWSAYGLTKLYYEQNDHDSLSDLLSSKSGQIRIGAMKAISENEKILREYQSTIQILTQDKNKSVRKMAEILLESLKSRE
jgi:hypothetical protein